MNEKAISQLDIQRFDGAFYAVTRKYLDAQGCTWSEQRDANGQLLGIHLDFPSGTHLRKSPGNLSQIVFPSGGMLWWTIKDDMNSVSVPVVYLYAYF